MNTELRGPVGEFASILSPEAIAFVADLQRQFGSRRRDLLQARSDRQERLDRGGLPGFLESTEEVRRSVWRVAPVPTDLVERKVEITGPVDRKVMINALNSGASLFMANFEDATSPSWANLIEGLGQALDDGRRIDAGLVRAIAAEEMAATTGDVGKAWKVFEKVFGPGFVEFLTLPAYELID